MIDKIFLGDFQGFSNARADLAPLTLIFGPNGSGKSSIGRALKLMKQSALTAAQKSGFVFSGPHIEFSSPKDAIRGQLRTKEGPSELSLGLSFANLGVNNAPSSVAYGFQEDLRSVRQEVSFSASFSNELKYQGVFESTRKGFLAKTAFGSIEGGLADLTEELETTFDALGSALRIKGILPVLDILEGPDHWSDFFDPNDVLPKALYNALEWAANLFHQELKRTNFVEPLRPIPSKLRLVEAAREATGEPSGPSGYQEKQLADLMLLLTGNRYELKSKKVQIAELDVTVEAQFVLDSHTGAELAFDQVGTGISQVAPLVADLVLGQGATYIEQPELHLHPKMQSILMNEYINAIQRDDSRQFIIETHSETMLLRTQKRIREGTLDPSLVSVLFVDKAELDDGTRFNAIQKLNLDELGDLDPLPVSFMDIRMQDLL